MAGEEIRLANGDSSLSALLAGPGDTIDDLGGNAGGGSGSRRLAATSGADLIGDAGAGPTLPRIHAAILRAMAGGLFSRFRF